MGLGIGLSYSISTMLQKNFNWSLQTYKHCVPLLTMGKYVKLTKTFMDDEGYMGKYVKLTKTFMDDEGYMGKYVKLTKTFILFKEYRFWCIALNA
jgi:hypothetical protein